MATRSRVVGVAGALLIAATSVGGVFASSHREAPAIAGDPGADNTDLYAFVSPDDPNSLTIIANYIPLEEPAGGPNFFPFDPDVKYEIKIDNDGDAKSDVTYSLRFSTKRTAKNFAGIPTFLYNDGPVTSLNDPNLLARQTYDVWRNDDLIANDVRVPPVNIGPRSTPNYADLAATAVKTLGDGTRCSPGSATTPSSSTSARSSIWPASVRSTISTTSRCRPRRASTTSTGSTPIRSRCRSRSRS